MEEKNNPRKVISMKLNCTKLILVLTSIVLIFIGWTKAAEAASLYLSPSSGSYTVGSTFSTNVYVSSLDQAMNAASGVILFPADKLQVLSISKTGSVISLWVQEPSFSNSAGTANFEGIVLNPGFIGPSGKIITINFKIKAAGSASLNFSSGSVLANDGRGTNILANMSGGNYSFSPSTIAPPVEEAPPEEYVPPPTPGRVPAIPVISSLTHPDENKWYSSNDPEFSWKLPPDVTGVSFLLNEKEISDPGPVSDGLIEFKKFEDIEDRIWYFHIKFQNESGWGKILHRKVLIDTEAPKPFSIEVQRQDSTDPQPTLVFETTDEISGVDYYEVKTDQGPSIQIKEKEYKIPVQTLGTHTIIVKAVDKAGNDTLAMTEINILPIETPVITDYPQTLLLGATLSIKGTAVPEAKVKVYIQKDEKETITEETKSDKEGKWSYIGTEPLEKGVYKIWVEAIDSLGAKSEPSEKVTTQVTSPVFIRMGKLAIDYLTTIITLLILISVIVFGIIWSWRKIIKRKKRLTKEISEAEKALYVSFKALKEETEKQIAKLDGKPDLSEREKKIYDDLKKALKISEKFISKEIEDIEKEL